MKRNKNILAIIFLLLSTIVVAQKKSNVPEYEKGVKELVNTGEGHLDIDEYDQAIKYLTQADKLQPKHPEISYLLGKVYIKIKRPDKAVSYLQVASDANYDEKTLNLELGLACQSVNKFDEAIAAFEKYKATLKDKDKAISTTERLIENCQNGKELVKKPVKVEIKNLGKGINTKAADYMPLVSADENTMIFTSRRQGSTGGQLDDHDSKYYEDIYIVEKKNDTTWGAPKNIGPTINTPSHDAAVGISPNGQQIFIHIINSKGLGDLYVSDLKGKGWLAPKSLGSVINLPTTNENSCSITPDGRILFFSSDRPGGQGGLDIWMSKLNEKGEWGTPINLGPKVNSSYDEESPFIHADGKHLYFSSKGLNSMGGFDIFDVEINPVDGSVVSEVENLGYPINTYADETFISWSADGLRAYFSSVREGSLGEEDIFVLSLPKTNEASHLVVYRGKIKDATSKTPIGANITIVDEATDKVIATTSSNSSTGKFLVVLQPGKDYGFEFDAAKHLFSSRNINVPSSKSFQLITDSIFMEIPKSGHKSTLYNIFFEDGKSKIKEEQSSIELGKIITLMTSHKSMKIQIIAHCFTEKDAESNMKLSEERAKAVVDYLKSKGIVATRLSYKPAGNVQPLNTKDLNENNRIDVEIK